MALWGMVIDLDKCTACQACVIACKAENNVPFVGKQQTSVGRYISWMQMITEIEGEYPNIRLRMIPRPCMHCNNPPCTKVCPVHATYRAPDGLVAQIYYRCIGCRFCMAACPYTVKYFNWYDYQVPESLQRAHNPDVSARAKGIVEKCTFCHHRKQKALEKARLEGRELAPGEYNTACAKACPSKAIYFGDLSDPNSEVSRLAKSTRAFKLLESLGTEPKVIYLSEGERHDR